MVGGHFVGSVADGDTLHCTALLYPDPATHGQLDWKAGPFIPMPGTVSVGALNVSTLPSLSLTPSSSARGDGSGDSDSDSGSGSASDAGSIRFGEFYLGGQFMWTQSVSVTPQDPFPDGG
eukprot:CAMPEP_0177628724 /NCGR_PEP_ID=MMETSP0447-20121125/284_1 /TAXON_ID=0 /ORGANISM="Stygamoeba regulata, Strain BSH-02190019" /LENGTH=119 /DNA_ID=CAMNT_0019129991 /DNA_START=386 /DNA_END=741 /DNA_ORIENTATION=-